MRRRTLLQGSLLGCAAPALAFHDPTPLRDVAPLQGEWRGTLTYDDYSRPGRLVTLPTTLFAAFASPTELVLHFVYDDGPGKTVYAYERMTFQMDKGVVVMANQGPRAGERTYSIVANRQDEGGPRRIVLERTVDAKADRLTLDLGASALTLRKEEIDAAGTVAFRNEYKLRRGAGNDRR